MLNKGGNVNITKVDGMDYGMSQEPLDGKSETFKIMQHKSKLVFLKQTDKNKSNAGPWQ